MKVQELVIAVKTAWQWLGQLVNQSIVKMKPQNGTHGKPLEAKDGTTSMDLKKNTPQTKTPVLCYEGWKMKDGNSSGRCCCNCKWQKYIVQHPWNKNSWSKGPIRQAMGYGCTVPDMPSIVFFDSQHGMCEMHDWRELNAESTTESA